MLVGEVRRGERQRRLEHHAGGVGLRLGLRGRERVGPGPSRQLVPDEQQRRRPHAVRGRRAEARPRSPCRRPGARPPTTRATSSGGWASSASVDTVGPRCTRTPRCSTAAARRPPRGRASGLLLPRAAVVVRRALRRSSRGWSRRRRRCARRAAARRRSPPARRRAARTRRARARARPPAPRRTPGTRPPARRRTGPTTGRACRARGRPSSSGSRVLLGPGAPPGALEHEQPRHVLRRRGRAGRASQRGPRRRVRSAAHGARRSGPRAGRRHSGRTRRVPSYGPATSASASRPAPGRCPPAGSRRRTSPCTTSSRTRTMSGTPPGTSSSDTDVRPCSATVRTTPPGGQRQVQGQRRPAVRRRRAGRDAGPGRGGRRRLLGAASPHPAPAAAPARRPGPGAAARARRGPYRRTAPSASRTASDDEPRVDDGEPGALQQPGGVGQRQAADQAQRRDAGHRERGAPGPPAQREAAEQGREHLAAVAGAGGDRVQGVHRLPARRRERQRRHRERGQAGHGRGRHADAARAQRPAEPARVHRHEQPERHEAGGHQRDRRGALLREPADGVGDGRVLRRPQRAADQPGADEGRGTEHAAGGLEAGQGAKRGVGHLWTVRVRRGHRA